MSHPFFWPGKYFFYPIGNTSAVSLTRHLPPEEPANILLLGCGDPRHVLYTIFSQPEASSRHLDFTCVDFEPGVLARNVLLFSLIADKIPIDTTWNIFFHMYLDPNSHAVLITQCKKLFDCSSDTESWRRSLYGPYLRVATEYTLAELRRHWSSYIALSGLSSRRQKAIRTAYSQVFAQNTNSKMVLLTSARSAGPLLFKAVDAASKQATNYWKTGTTFLTSKELSATTLINATFAYSLSGEGCAVHYGTDPLTPFHFSPVFGNAKGSVSADVLVRSAKAQFREWCTAFEHVLTKAATVLRIRFCLAEATAACRALRSFGAAGALSAGIPVAQFRTQFLRLDKVEYVEQRAPSSFNVIETSNLIDHIGLLNILVAAVPLMSPSPWTVLYTESLLFRGEDATKEFAELLYADIGTMGMLLDLCPIDYLSGFSTRSNTHEIMMYRFVKKDQDRTQFHQVTTWRSPASCDSVVALNGARSRFPPVLNSQQLGTLLFDVYHAMFEQEDAMSFFKQNQRNMLRAISSSNLIHYMREGFVLLLKLVGERLRIPVKEWEEVMDRFMDLEQTDPTMPMNTVNRNDLYAHLHRQGVHTVNYYKRDMIPRIGRFSEWDVVPPIVRVVLSVPREMITAFENILGQTQVGTPPVQCDLRGSWSHNIFSAVHVAFGRVISTGTQRSPCILFEEDPEGRKGMFPLIASFVVPSLLLTDIEPQENLNVRLCVRSTTGTVPLHEKLGLDLEIFSARLMDEEHVHILPEPCVPSVKIKSLDGPLFSPNAALQTQIGQQDAVTVELDEQCELMSLLTARVDLKDTHVIREFGGGATPQIAQVSPCMMRLTVAGHNQDVVFPFPVIGTQNKLRLARKSRYIEVVLPAAGPFLKPDGMKLNPFPIVGNGKALGPWNVHHLSLDRLPLLDSNALQLDIWLNPHVGSMLSERERKMRKKHKSDALLFVKDTIHAIFVRSAGIQGGEAKRVFALRDEATNNCDTIFFVGDLRFDVHSHTVVCDAYVLPLTHDIMPRIANVFGKTVHDGSMVNVNVFEGETEAWKQLLPAFVERCRTWEHTDTCEYLVGKEVPLTQKMEVDPLCSCGRGKDVEGLRKVDAWRTYAPYVTRLALSPLFAVSYLETVGRDPAAHKCSVCRGRGKPKIMVCKGCQKVRYCSTACQKKDWPRHKHKCKSKS